MKILLSIIAFSLIVQTAGAPQRLPFKKKPIVLVTPKEYGKRVLRVVPATGESISYDHKPRVVFVNPKSGVYNLVWIGSDRKEKRVSFQLPNALDAVVSATAASDAGGYQYAYAIELLPSSGQYLFGFAVQTFASDARTPQKEAGIMFGQMSDNVLSNKGHWVHFGLLSAFRPRAQPGQTVKLELVSAAPPGLVECRIHGGDQTMIAPAFDDIPEELIAQIPGYEAWPSSYTIGPVDLLRAFTLKERGNYLLQNLPRMRQQGWMTAATFDRYQQLLEEGNIEEVIARADDDLKSKSITTEVHSMIKAMSNGSTDQVVRSKRS